MQKRVFVNGKNLLSQAYYGWQDKDLSLIGLIKGYWNSANDLLNIALTKGSKNDIASLDTYIFPIIFLYRHALEISLKHAYYRTYGKLPNNSHDLIVLFDIVKKEVIDLINSTDYIEDVKQHKNNFIPYSMEGIDFVEVRRLICELQGADNRADVWRYLLDTKENLYFSTSKFIDYNNLHDVLNELLNIFDYIRFVINEYLSGD